MTLIEYTYDARDGSSIQSHRDDETGDITTRKVTADGERLSVATLTNRDGKKIVVMLDNVQNAIRVHRATHRATLTRAYRR